MDLEQMKRLLELDDRPEARLKILKAFSERLGVSVPVLVDLAWPGRAGIENERTEGVENA